MKYILFFPPSGFNDMLCDMHMLWCYAELYNRTLVVDATCFHLYERLDNFFISSTSKIFLHPTENLFAHLKTLCVYPHCLDGHIGNFRFFFERWLRLTVEEKIRMPLSIDFSKDYKEELLVYCGSGVAGGSDAGVNALSRMRLQKNIAKTVLEAISTAGSDYDAIHVRNTDYHTDYIAFFKSIFPRVAGRKLLICSDDYGCREFAKLFFVESQVMFTTTIPDLGNAPLHMQKKNVFQGTMTMLIDLFTLAQAKNLYLAETKNGGLSGFSRLAKCLHDQTSIQAHLLHLPDTIIPNRRPELCKD